MIRKKICLLGAPEVGKTSLVRQFVDSIFDTNYQRTIGVKIDKKIVECKHGQVTLMIWDIQGQEDTSPVRDSYLRGMEGYLLVIDSSRPDTAETALSLQQRIEEKYGPVPFILCANKADLITDWSTIDNSMQGLAQSALATIKTSAKTGQDVNRSFSRLAEAILLDKRTPTSNAE